MYRRTKKAFGK